MHSTHKQNYQTIESPNLWLLTAYTHKSPDFRGAFIYYTDSESSSLMIKKKRIYNGTPMYVKHKINVEKKRASSRGRFHSSANSAIHTHTLFLSVYLSHSHFLTFCWVIVLQFSDVFVQVNCRTLCVVYVCVSLLRYLWQRKHQNIDKEAAHRCGIQVSWQKYDFNQRKKNVFENELWMMMPMSGNRFALHNRT